MQPTTYQKTTGQATHRIIIRDVRRNTDPDEQRNKTFSITTTEALQDIKKNIKHHLKTPLFPPDLIEDYQTNRRTHEILISQYTTRGKDKRADGKQRNISIRYPAHNAVEIANALKERITK